MAPDLLVVVPGIGGSVLRRGSAVLWDPTWSGFARAMLERGEQFEALTLADPGADDGVVATGLIDGIHVIPSLWSYGSYTPLTRHLRKMAGAANVVEFPYDWRRSNSATARLLKARIDAEVAARPDGTQVVLVAHSMGGLVARRWLACEGGAERCRMLLTIGTPYRGAAKALDALANGLRWVPGRAGRRLHTFLQSLPSVHELLPAYDCLVQPDNTRTGLAANRPAALAGSALLDPAMAFHAETAKALGSEQPFETIAIVGQRQPTRALARERDGQIELLRDDVWEGTAETVHCVGDGTVPRGSAQPPEWGERVAGAYANSGRHLNLAQHRRVWHDVEAAITGGQFLGLGDPERGGFGIDLPDVLAHGAPLVVQACHDSDRLGLTLEVIDRAVHTVVKPKAFCNLGDGRYDAVVRDLDPGIYEVAATGDADGAPRRPHRLPRTPSRNMLIGWSNSMSAAWRTWNRWKRPSGCSPIHRPCARSRRWSGGATSLSPLAPGSVAAAVVACITVPLTMGRDQRCRGAGSGPEEGGGHDGDPVGSPVSVSAGRHHDRVEEVVADPVAQPAKVPHVVVADGR